VSELAALYRAAMAAWAQGETPVLATVLETRGSSYRKRGARMLVTRAGWQAGSISGGCLEADVVRRAAWLVSSGEAVVRTYDTSVDGEVALGCGGEVDVLLEPFHADSEFARALEAVVTRREVATVTLTPPGRAPWTQRLTPPPRLVVAGGGHDALPVHAMAAALGWDVHVVDWRSANVTAARFPGAGLHLLGPDALAQLPLEAGCAVVVMSHHFVYDTQVLNVVLTSPLPGYVGVLGPRQRTAELLKALPSTASRARLHAPVGLPLGGEGPASVALSIVSEVHAYFERAPLFHERKRRVAGIVLAAGSSSRLGRPKQLVVRDHETLVHRAARLALEAGCSPVVVVEGAVSLAAAVADQPVELVRCEDWARGPGASLKRAMAHLAMRAEGALVLLVDQPDVTVDDLRRLLDAPGDVAAAQYDGVLGVPARFSGAKLAVLCSVPDERGAGGWLRAHADEVTAVPMPGAARDVDTPEDLGRP
jgi:xanthine/CO dehydrogenase XdhC/CoxF family maturation factor/CTP:molybdopterin cytidylyltransferase MocA